jgi:pyruvate/2-oxoglutarate dehydrogenase complex dihydrolipoamide dehydrogenase (E3) component
VVHGFDLVVIGGGAAGITAAREGARRAARTALVQDGPLGGDCTFTGCVPSKALLAAAARGASFKEAMAAVAVLSVDGLREVAHLTNETLFGLRARPRRVAVLGGGATGCEMSPALARLGASVTVFEVEDRLLPGEEPETVEAEPGADPDAVGTAPP